MHRSRGSVSTVGAWRPPGIKPGIKPRPLQHMQTTWLLSCAGEKTKCCDGSSDPDFLFCGAVHVRFFCPTEGAVWSVSEYGAGSGASRCSRPPSAHNAAADTALFIIRRSLAELSLDWRLCGTVSPTMELQHSGGRLKRTGSLYLRWLLQLFPFLFLLLEQTIKLMMPNSSPLIQNSHFGHKSCAKLVRLQRGAFYYLRYPNCPRGTNCCLAVCPCQGSRDPGRWFISPLTTATAVAARRESRK